MYRAEDTLTAAQEEELKQAIADSGLTLLGAISELEITREIQKKDYFASEPESKGLWAKAIGALDMAIDAMNEKMEGNTYKKCIT